MLIQMHPYLWDSGIWEVQLVRGSVRCLGFTKGSTAKRICRPRIYIYSLNIYTVHIAFIGFPVLAVV